MSKRTDLALQALVHLDSHLQVSGPDLADAIGVTTNYLPQVLRPLVTNGWISGTPGPGGGYAIEVELDEISVLDVIEITEGIPEADRCVLRGVPCPAPEPCALHDVWEQVRDTLLAELGSTALTTTLDPAPTKGE